MNVIVETSSKTAIARCLIARNAAFFLLLLAPIAALTQVISTSPPPLSPQPRELHLSNAIPLHSAIILVPGGDAEDNFAARNLSEALKQRGVMLAPAVGAVDATIELLRNNTPEATQLLSAAHLSFDAAMHDEGYILVSRRDARGHPSVAIIGDTAAGVFYGAQTFKQLIAVVDGIPTLPLGTIRDWPAMKYRGVHDDLSRGPFPTLAFQKHQLQVFAAHKVNLYSPYFEHTLQYSSDPLAAPPGSSLTRSESQELAAFARNLHILIVPEQEAFGHLHHVLQYEKYSDLAETPHGHVLAPGQAATQPLILGWFTQIAADFPSPFLHIGADETFELGTGRTKADVDKRGLGPVYADFLTQIHTTLAPLHRRILFWGDVAGTDPAAIPGLPKDMIAIPWIYWHEDSYDHDILPFRNAGIETWVAPGDANWKVVYPNVKVSLDNITGFVEAGQRLGSTGELTVVWNDDGEGLFNLDWFTVLYGAAAGWQPGKSDSSAYTAAFGHVFYGDTSGRIDSAQKELVASEDLIDTSDDAFWLDPWSKAGIAAANKLRAKLATDPSLREQDALKAMELAARRIDFIGMKFQLSDEMRSAYARAYTLRNEEKHSTEARELLYSITSMNGRCQDLRDAYSMLKNLYRESWLAENRPFWLDNVLVRYDLQIQLWQKRGYDINTLIDQWQDNKALPTSEAAGIPPPTP
jgi:hexosaminidase